MSCMGSNLADLLYLGPGAQRGEARGLRWLTLFLSWLRTRISTYAPRGLATVFYAFQCSHFFSLSQIRYATMSNLSSPLGFQKNKSAFTRKILRPSLNLTSTNVSSGTGTSFPLCSIHSFMTIHHGVMPLPVWTICLHGLGPAISVRLNNRWPAT